ncbi:MAG TPA: DUF4097 family beta strand repeat-containing protein [Ktedonobacteraceae bacterium]|nr:DUF4097 family beta strand repeat-containing protein [Ktedonobacteraceae bacterium]
MSDQEMQFADPDWQPTGQITGKNDVQSKQESAAPRSPQPSYQPRPINDEWREQAQQSQQAQPSSAEMPPGSSQSGYDGLPPYAGYAGSMPSREQPYANQNPQFYYQRRRRRPWLWLIALILLCSLLGGGFSSLGNLGEKNLVENRTFNFNGTPTIVLHETSGNIQVQQGDANSSLTIHTDKHAGFFDDPSNIRVNYQQSGSIINVNVNPGSGFLSDRSVDFTITVPQNVILELQTDSGDISIDNISGQATLSTESGNISASNDTFSANTSLHTTSGDVRAVQDTFGDGTVISATSGDITLDHDTLQGSEKFNDTSGSIDFNGAIDPNGNYQFNVISGDITIALQQTDNFSVSAKTTSGSIHAEDFPSIQVQNTTQGANSASGSVGSSPYAQFTLSTVSGDISINRR